MKNYFFKNNPAFKILIPFVLGIVFAVLFELNHYVFFLLSGIAFCLLMLSMFLVRFNQRMDKGILLSIALLFFGISLVNIRTELNHDQHFSKFIMKDSKLVVMVDEEFQEKEKSYKTNLKVVGVVNGSRTLQSVGKVLAYFKKDSLSPQYQYGDVLLISARVSPVTSPSNPEQFNYKHYLKLNNINHQLFVNNHQVVPLNRNNGNWLIKKGYELRDHFCNILVDNGIKGDELKVASALLLGYREMLDKDLVKSYSSAGAMHVLAVSGLHVGIIFFLLKFSLGFLKRLRQGKYVFVFIILLALWFYALMTGFSPSVLRATTMFSFVLVGEQLINRKTSIYNTLAVSAIVLLVVNPYLIFEVGFQLSYLAVVGIVYLQPRIYNWFYVPNKILDHAWKITAVSLAAQIATFPLGLYYFHQFPVYFFVSNLLVIPVAILIIYFGVLLFVTSFIPVIAGFIGVVLAGVISFLNQAIFITEELPFSLVEEIAISRTDTYLLYVILISILVFTYYRRLKYFYLGGSLLLLFVVIQVVNEIGNSRNKDFTVYAVRNETAMEFSIGNTSYLITSKEMWNDENKMLFNIHHNWFRKNITKPIFIAKDSLAFNNDHLIIQDNVIWFQGLTLLKLTEESFIKLNQLTIDYLWVDKDNINLLYKVEKEIRNTIILFDSSVPSYRVKYWQKRIKNGSILSTYDRYFHKVIE